MISLLMIISTGLSITEAQSTINLITTAHVEAAPNPIGIRQQLQIYV